MANDLNIQNAVLAAILENAVDAIITIDESGLIVSANPAAQKHFGYTIDEMLGENVKMLMPSPYSEQHDDYLANYHNSGIKKIIGIGREVVGRRSDGTTFPMHLAVSEITIGDRNLFIGFVRDISDVKDVESKLESLNAELENRVEQQTSQLREAQAELVRIEKFATLGKVAGGIAHEIRNPLNAIKTSAYYLLNAKNITDEKVREHLERIDRQVNFIDNVVTALSDVAKLPDARLFGTNVNSVINSAMESIQLSDDIDFEMDLEADLPEVMVDTNQIVIAIKNLVRNARDAMPDGGVLTISFTSDEQTVSIHVADTGSGISPENLDKIFEPLFTTKARGMGLGLSITKAIVEKNRGTIKIESELGKGSRFSIELMRVLSERD